MPRNSAGSGAARPSSRWLVAGGALMAAASAGGAAPPDMTLAQSDYVEHCSGCHGVQGSSAPSAVPVLRDRVGWFLCLPEGRDYLLRLPNVAHSRIADNAQLAELMNFVAFGLGGVSTPAGAQAFTAEEVATQRPRAMTSVSLVRERERVVARMISRCRAPASLHYPPAKPTRR